MSAKALRDDAINIFTDGSGKQNPRRGGIAFRIVVTGEDGHEEIHERSPHGYPRATINEMELQACVAALRVLTAPRCPIDVSRHRRIVIYTDAMYVRKHIGVAISQWSRQQWTRR
jgi:ribonuclease HI